MARNDPSDTGGLFIGRRPGTGPVRYRSTPERGGRRRRALDGALAAAVLVLEGLICLSLWGPQPAAWLWAGSQVDYRTGAVLAGILVAFAGMIGTLLLSLAAATRLDALWKVLRRAAGHEQKQGALARLFAATAVLAGLAFLVWFVVIEGPGPTLSRLREPVRRLLAYYKQFGELSPEEVSTQLREHAQERRESELARVAPLDLSATTWHEPPHPEAVNAATFALRRALNRYPGARADALRDALAARHAVAAEQVVLGHGAGELLQAALVALLRAGHDGEVLVGWPAWPVLPAMVARAGGRPIRTPLGAAAAAAAVTARTRAAIVCSPNDPTGDVVTNEDVRALAAALPPAAWLLLDEALADWLAPGADAAVLLRELPNLLVVRSFSKAHALAGLRIGYALGPPQGTRLLADLAPVQGVGAPAQAAALWATENGEPVLERRRRAVAAEQRRLAQAGARFTATPAPFVWLGGAGLAARLAAHRIAVAPGALWGDDAHVRAAIGDPAATDRLAQALRAPAFTS